MIRSKSLFLLLLVLLARVHTQEAESSSVEVPAQEDEIVPESAPEENIAPLESKEEEDSSPEILQSGPSETEEDASEDVGKTAVVAVGRSGIIADPGKSKMGQLIDIDPGYEHIDGRVSPTITFNANGEPYVISQTRLESIRKKFLYWFYDQGGDENIGDYQRDIHSSITQIHKNFNFQLPFFGFRFNYTRISVHGYLEFSDPPPQFTYPLTFPIKDWPAQNDPAFIGIFYSKCRIGFIRVEDEDQRKPGVYFRLERDLQGRTDQFGVEMRERLKWDIRQGVIGAETFDPKHAVTVTWKNVSFAGGIGNSLFKTNSFQMVLATDEVYTYAIFNYAELSWSSHTEAGGDTTGGEGGVPAFIGFNAGNGTQSFEYQPYSQSSVLRDLTSRGWANGMPGRHIFRIDEKIMLGTCNKDIDGANLPLVFAPESGNMLGGNIVNITGPCFFKATDRIRCRFDTEVVTGKVIDTNRAVCVQPQLLVEGYIRFEVSVNTENYKWKSLYFIETPATATEKIRFETTAVHEKSPPEIKITWDRNNLTTNGLAKIQMSLWGYRETKIRPEILFIDMLALDVTNIGSHIITPSEFRNRDNYLTSDLQFGFIQINLTQPIESDGLSVTPVLWSKPIPLGWYFGPQWERLYGNKWPEKMCNNWLVADRFYKNFAADVPLCPCTLEQALLDKGRFLPDFGCDKDSDSTCYYHKGAVHCVRTGIPSMEGSGQQCCYDKNHYLMLSYDQQWGSRPLRSHNLGFLPWNEANKVPTLSHWFHDQAPYYQCCLWQEEQAVGCETYRFERRPTQDCVAYQSPGIAATFGDPHIITFDGTAYTFNGKGEFVLVRTDVPSLKLDVQGRFEQVPKNIYGDVMATQLTSIVAAGNDSHKIEVRVRPKYAQWRYRLDVFANEKRVYFDRQSLKVQHFPGVTVYTPTYILNQSEVVIMFQSGAGVEVVENQGFLTARVFLPWTYINKTRGLFGNWSWDQMDDFTRPDGTTAGINLNNFETAHNDFGKYWMLSDRAEEGKGAGMFVREFGRTASFYANATFKPNYIKEPADFLPSNRTVDINRATELCGESYQCRYDYGMSLDRDMAHFTRNYYDSIINMREVTNKRILSCGVLETPRFGRKSNFFFVPGTKVTFECNQNFILIGDERRTCLPEGKWDVPLYGYTECLREQEYSSRQAAITWGFILLVMVPILLFVGCCFFRHMKGKKNEKQTAWSLQKFEPKYRSNSKINLRSASLGNLTEPDDSTLSKKSIYLRQQSEPNILDQDYPTIKTMSTFKAPPDSTYNSESPNSDRGLTALPKNQRRSYEKIYRTNEPLRDKPNEEFPEKSWDLTEEPISSGSDDGSQYTGTLTKPAKDIQYVSQNKPRQYGRRAMSNEKIGDSGYSTAKPETPIFVPYIPKDEDFLSSSQNSPTTSYSPSTSPFSEQSSPKHSYNPSSYHMQPLPEEPVSAPPDKSKKFTLPFMKGRSVDTLERDANTLGIESPDEDTAATFSSKTTMV